MKYLRLVIGAMLVALALASCDTVSPGAPATTAPAQGGTTETTSVPAAPADTSAYPIESTAYPAP